MQCQKRRRNIEGESGAQLAIARIVQVMRATNTQFTLSIGQEFQQKRSDDGVTSLKILEAQEILMSSQRKNMSVMAISVRIHFNRDNCGRSTWAYGVLHQN